LATTYYIKTPRKGVRKTFALIARQRIGAKLLQKTVANDDLAAINSSLLAGKLSSEAAHKAAKAIATRLNQTQKLPDLHHPFNLQIIAQYLQSEYEGRDIVPGSLTSITYDFKRAILAIGQLSLAAATRQELQTAVNTLPPRKQRRVVSRINSLLGYLNRDFRLKKLRDNLTPPAHMSEREMLSLAAAICLKDPIFGLMIKVAFYTGCRLGELLTLEPSSLRNSQYLFIYDQIAPDGQRRPPKTRKSRNAIIIPQGVQLVEEWCQLPLDEKLPYRTPPRLISKHTEGRFRFHDLRHSYARYLADKGVGISELAEYMGHSVVVCEARYKGWVRSQDAIESRFNRLQSSS
jgi:integrase